MNKQTLFNMVISLFSVILLGFSILIFKNAEDRENKIESWASKEFDKLYVNDQALYKNDMAVAGEVNKISGKQIIFIEPEATQSSLSK